MCRLRYRLSSSIPYRKVPQHSFAYLFVTHNFCTTIYYTALNLPYGSLSAMMTRISKERDMLSITRTTLSPLGKILAVSATRCAFVKMFRQSDGWVES